MRVMCHAENGDLIQVLMTTQGKKMRQGGFQAVSAEVMTTHCPMIQEERALALMGDTRKLRGAATVVFSAFGP